MFAHTPTHAHTFYRKVSPEPTIVGPWCWDVLDIQVLKHWACTWIDACPSLDDHFARTDWGSKILAPTMHIWGVPMCLAQSCCCCHVAMPNLNSRTHAAWGGKGRREAALGRLRGLVSSLQPETVQWDYILNARLQRDNRFLVSMYLVATPSGIQH